MIADRVAALDTGLFAHVGSETTEEDRRSLLAIHKAVAARCGSFSYLEIGSHLGGTLQVVIADPRCARAVSIDPRPPAQPDDRPGQAWFEYRDNSTKRMLALLEAVPGADLSKLETVEASTEDIAPGAFARPDVCLIDGEHTRRAALRDGRFCRAVLQGAGIVVFHDFWIVERAILDFMRETPRPRRGFRLRGSLFVVELGAGPSLLEDPDVRRRLTPRGRIVADSGRADTWLLAAHLRRRRGGAY